MYKVVIDLFVDSEKDVLVNADVVNLDSIPAVDAEFAVTVSTDL